MQLVHETCHHFFVGSVEFIWDTRMRWNVGSNSIFSPLVAQWLSPHLGPKGRWKGRGTFILMEHAETGSVAPAVFSSRQFLAIPGNSRRQKQTFVCFGGALSGNKGVLKTFC